MLKFFTWCEIRWRPCLSGLSLVTGVLDGRFGFWKLPEEKRQGYIERLHSAFLELSMRFHDDYVNKRIPKENIMIVSYAEMMKNFEKVMREVNKFIGVTPSPAVSKNIKRHCGKTAPLCQQTQV